MKLKWKLLIVIVVLWLCGTIGIAWHTYSTCSSASSVGTTPPATPIPAPSPLAESVKFALLMLGGLGVIMPTYLNIWQSLETSNIYSERLRFDRADNAYKILERWNNPGLLEARRFTREMKALHKKLSPNEIVNRINTNKQLQESVILVFNYWDGVRISINTNRADGDLLKDNCHSAFIDIYERFLPWIETQSAQYRTDLKELYDMWKR